MIEGVIYKVAYLFSRHQLFGNSLTRWLVVLSALATGVVVWNVFRVPAVALVLALIGGGVVGSILWRARRQRYMRFVPQTRLKNQVSAPRALSMGDKVPVRATGHFEVNGVHRYFVEATAHFQAFESRERVVMANILPSRLLLIARTPDHDWGWWYTFFQPSMVNSVGIGQLHFGASIRPALKIELKVDAEADSEVLFLSFDDEGTRAVVWADLQVDAVVSGG